MATNRKLKKLEVDVLLHAYRFGDRRPLFKEAITACQYLVGRGFFGEHDGSPGTYHITLSGETEIERILAIRKAA